MSSVEQGTSTVSPGHGATGEEVVRTVGLTQQVVYPQRALIFLIILVFTFLVVLFIIGLIGLKWINRNQNICGVPSS